MATSLPEHVQDIDAFLLRWAQDNLDEVVQDERVNEIPYCVRALEHLLSQQAGRPVSVMVGLQPGSTRKARATGATPVAA